MAHPLDDLLDQLQAALPTIAGLTFGRGQLAVNQNGGWPRIVLAGAAQHQFAPARGVGGRPRNLMGIFWAVEAHCFAADEQQAYNLTLVVLQTVDGLWRGSYEPTGLVDRGAQEPDVQRRGAEYVLTLALRADVKELLGEPNTVRITDFVFDTDGAAPGDGVLQAGET